MNLQDICTDLKWSKRLKKKGFPQESYFRELRYRDSVKDEFIKVECSKDVYDYILAQDSTVEIGFISLPTAEEILRELPSDVYIKTLGEGFYFVSWDIIKSTCYTDKKLCNALAKMYYYLADNKLLKGAGE